MVSTRGLSGTDHAAAPRDATRIFRETGRFPRRLGNKRVAFRIERSLDNNEIALAEIRSRDVIVETWDVTLPKPLGLTLSDQNGKPAIQEIKKGGSASRADGRIREGDRVVAVESAFGGRMWDVTTVGEVLAAAALPTRPSLTLRLERDVKVGPWSGLLRKNGEPKPRGAEAARDRVRQDVGDALNAYLELRRANLPATATASLVLERCGYLAKTYVRRADLVLD